MRLMRILLALFFCVLIDNDAISQDGRQSPGSSVTLQPSPDFLSKMGEVLTSPPNTAAIERFGGVDVDLNTGVVKKSIELRPFVSRGMTVPVSLGFSSLGLRVNDYPTRTGMGWSLSAGGQISRAIYGKDDLIATRYPPNFTVNPSQDDPQFTTYAFELINGGNRDATPDMFTYSFGGYSGKFFFDNSNTIQQVEITNLKIEYNPILNAAWTFKVSTPDGSVYLFGGPGATEKTKIGGTMNFSDYVANAWHLISITNRKGQSIYFTYEEDFISLMLTDKSQTQYKNSPTPIQECQLPSGGLVPTNVTANATMTPSDVTSYMSSKPKRLRKIYNNEGDSLVFDCSETGYPEKLYTKLSYYYNGASVQLQYLFEYINVTSGISTMPFLNKIVEKGANGALKSTGYAFNYYSRNSVPERFSYSQDHWGFYNGKYNSTLIPVPDDPIVAQNFPNATANREPDPYYAVAGMLSSVSYPTGGKDSIIYEPNTKSEYKDVNGYTTLQQNVTANSSYETQYLFTATQGFNLYYDGQVKITITSEYTIPDSPSPHAGSQLEIQNSSGQVVFREYVYPPQTGSTTKTFYITLPIGYYSYKTGAQGANVKSTTSIRIRSGQTPNNQIVQTIIGGMRVKKVITSNNSANPDMVKRYYYGTIDNKEQSTAQYDLKPNYYLPNAVFHSAIYDYHGCLGTYCLATNYASVMYSSPREKLYATDGKLTAYTSVIESIGGDDFEGGAVEHKYQVVQDAAPQIVRGPVSMSVSPYSNSSVWALGETETNYYKKSTSGLVKIKSDQYETIVDSRKGVDLPFYLVSQTGTIQCMQWNNGMIIGPEFIHSMISATRFNIATAWKYLKILTQIEYDENGQNPLTVVTEYEYNDLQYLMLTKRKYTNSKGETYVESFKYPNDYNTLPPYNQMILDNWLDPVIEQKSVLVKQGNVEKDLVKTNVDYTYVNGSMIEPTEVFKTMETQTSSELKILEYDAYRNIRRTEDKAGNNTVYLWGYGGRYAVAKVVVPGLSYAAVISTSGLYQSVLDNMATTPGAMAMELNKLRSIPNSFVSTFVFRHPLGIISETDPNGISKYYEYDQFGRLTLVRDKDNNILKRICYNYYGMVENCASVSSCVDLNADWQNTTTPLRCQLSGCSYSGYQEQEQKDMNPCSPTYNTTRWVTGAYNPAVCSGSGGNITLTYNNQILTNGTGYTAVYTNLTTSQVYTFNIPGFGSGTLGCVPTGTYSLTISKPGNGIYLLFDIGCMMQGGTSAVFSSVNVSSCNQVVLSWDIN